MAVMWMDRDRRYFISTTGTTNLGTPIYRERWRTANGVSEKVEMEIQIPDVCETYYDTCSRIDRHNRCRQDDLKLEKKLEVKDWSMRVNSSLLAICVVDAWLLYKGTRGSCPSMNPNEFYSLLAEGLIETKYDSIGSRKRRNPNDDEEFGVSANSMVSGVGAHLTPTNRKRQRKDGTDTGAIYQGRCSICRGFRKSKYVCSQCRAEKKRMFLSGTVKLAGVALWSTCVTVTA